MLDSELAGLEEAWWEWGPETVYPLVMGWETVVALDWEAAHPAVLGWEALDPMVLGLVSSCWKRVGWQQQVCHYRYRLNNR